MGESHCKENRVIHIILPPLPNIFLIYNHLRSLISKEFMGVSSNGRVLMLLENNGYPGDTRVRREALALVQEGFEVSVIAPKEGPQPAVETVDGVQVYRYPAPLEHDSVLGFAWEFIYSTAAAFFMSLRVWITKGFDVIHAHSPPDTLFVVGAFYKLFGKKFVFDHHDLSPELYQARSDGKGNPVLYRILLFLEKMTFWTSNLVIATNESYRTIAMERGNVKKENTTIVRNGPPLSIMGDDEPYSDLVNTGKFLFGYVGAISIQDGLEYLVHAVRHLKETYNRTDILCIIMGDGDDLERIKGLVREQHLEELFLFTGWVEKEELGRYLASIDIGVDPDPSNDFNDKCTMIKMTEYMVYGKPIVAFDLPEHRFTAQDAAVYVPENDPRLFAKALLDLMDDPIRREVMGRFARKRVESEIAWEYSVPPLVESYHRLFGRNVRIQPAVKEKKTKELVKEPGE